MKRAVLGLTVGTAVFGSIYGLAASLTVTSQTLGSGNTLVAACQTGTLTASYTTTYNPLIPGYEIAVVTVSGLEAGCQSKTFKVDLVNGTTSLSALTSSTGSGTAFTADFGSVADVPAASVTGAHVLITG